MPQLEESAVAARPLIDLREIRQEHRALMWDTAVRSAFPGLSVRLAQTRHLSGSIERIVMGGGEIFTIESAAAEVLHRGARARGEHPHFSVMVLSRGSIRVRQAGRTALLQVGDMCMIDESKSFRLASEGSSRMLFVRLPRVAVLGRYPHLSRQMVETMSGDAPGTRMLADTLLRASREAGALCVAQRSAMMGAFIHMLGLAELFAARPGSPDWRVRRAFDYIALNLSVTGLTAETIAQDQNISRRRLDQLMQDASGHSISSHLWSRRLEQAAADLRDPQRADLSVAQIAFANGFEDAAHFTRAFKKRFAITPGQWRMN